MGLRGLPSGSGDVQDEVINKVKFMMETYLPHLNEIVHRLNIKLQQAKPEEIDVLKKYKAFGERYHNFLRNPLIRFQQWSLEKLIPHKKQILAFIGMFGKARHLTGEQLSQSQMAQLKHQHNNQMINKPQIQPRISRNPQPTTMHQNAVGSMQQHGSLGQGNCLTSSQEGGASVGGPMQKSIINVPQHTENLNTLSQNNMSLLI